MMLVKDGCVKETDDPRKIEDLENKGFKRYDEDYGAKKIKPIKGE